MRAIESLRLVLTSHESHSFSVDNALKWIASVFQNKQPDLYKNDSARLVSAKVAIPKIAVNVLSSFLQYTKKPFPQLFSGVIHYCCSRNEDVVCGFLSALVNFISGLEKQDSLWNVREQRVQAMALCLVLVAHKNVSIFLI